MNFNNLFDLSPFALVTIIFLLICLVGFLGNYFRKNWRKKHPEITLKGRISAAAFGILSLLMAFTFSVAMSKFETQRRLIAQEAAYINTALLRCDIYPDSLRNLLRTDFKEYIEARIAYYDELDSDKSKEERKKAELIAKRIWEKTVLQMQNSESAVRSAQMIPAVNNMMDIAITRDGEKISKVPMLVLWVLLIFMVIDGFVVGIEIFDKNKPLVVMFANAIVMSLTLNLIIELHQPRTGLINLDAVEQKIVDLRELVK
jgi:hypothetical protein